MSLPDIFYKIKSRFSRAGSTEVFELSESGEVERHPYLRKFFLSLVIILTALASFGLGRLSSFSTRQPIDIHYEDFDLEGQQTASGAGSPETSIKISDSKIENSTGAVTASSKGTKYYTAGCKSTISDKNKVAFATAALAEAAGYTKASACK
jgi:hypothetical protein